MSHRLPIALAAFALVGTAIVSTTFAASAPQDEGKWHHVEPSPEDRAAFQDARLAALHAGLTLTPAQEKLWPPVEAALRDFGKLVADQHKKMHAQKEPLDPVAKLQQQSDNLIARGQAMKKLADAEAPLYMALSEAQKRRLPMLAHAIFHHPFGGGRFAMATGWHEHGPDAPPAGAPGPGDHEHE